MSSRFASLLALLVLATGGASPASDALQQRVDALAQQVHLRYQHHAPSLAERRLAVEAALEQWNEAAAQRDAGSRNTEVMLAWLDAALRSVMAGGSGVIPPAPFFEVEASSAAAPMAVGPPTRPQEEPVLLEPLATAPRVTIEPGRTAGPTATGPRSQFAGPRATRQLVAKPVAPAEPSATTASPSRSKWSQHPAAAPLDWRDPFADDPTASENPLRTGARRQALRPSFTETASIQLDLTLLMAEVRGFNAALQALQAAVLTLEEGDLAALEAAADELEQLAERREFLDLYREGLTASQRRALPESPSVDLVRELVRRKVRALAEQVPPRRAEDRRALERLSDRLASGQNEAASR